MANRRGGGQNTGSSAATIADITSGGARLKSNLLAGQRSQDFGRNLQFQQYLAGAPLQQASAESGLYGVATGGEASTAKDLESYAENQQKAWYQQLAQLGQLGVGGIQQLYKALANKQSQGGGGDASVANDSGTDWSDS